MGGGSSSSSTEKKTDVKTTTTTTIRDIGLTGSDAVYLASVLENGATSREQLQLGYLDQFRQDVLFGWNKLIGGASDLVVTGEKVSKEAMAQGADVGISLAKEGRGFGESLLDVAESVVGLAGNLAEEAMGYGKNVLQVSSDVADSMVQAKQEPESDFVKMIPWVAVAVAAVFMTRKG